MPDFKASVYSDGTVIWSISGGLKTFCAFTGLGQIPFDTLGCQVLFGANSREASPLIHYVLEVPDFFFFGDFDVTYNEWKVAPEMAKQGYAVCTTVYYVL